MKRLEKTYSERMEDAKNDRANGMTLQAAGNKNNIKTTTLYRALTQKIVLKRGRQQYITMENELELIKTAIYLGNRGFGMTYSKFIVLATDCVNSMRPNSTPLITLSHKWWEGFRSRHPTFSCLKPKGRVDIAKTEAEENEDAILSFYEEYENLNIKYNFTPAQVWNADETGSSQRESAAYIVGDRKQRCIGSKVGKNALHMTMLACISAEGACSPPLFILKGDEMDSSVLLDSPLYSNVTNSESAYINEGIFNEWFIKWIKWIRAETQSPILLIVDNCSSHTRYSTVSIALANNIELLALPPNLTHILQPLDVCIFRSFKAKIRATLADYLTLHHTRKLNQKQFIDLCCNAVSLTFIKESIASAFKSIGLFPIDANKAFERLQQGVIFSNAIVEDEEILDIESKQRKVINELQMEIMRLRSEACITAAVNSVPKRRSNKVKNVLARVLTHSEVQELPIVQSKPRGRPKKQKTEASSDS